MAAKMVYMPSIYCALARSFSSSPRDRREVTHNEDPLPAVHAMGTLETQSVRKYDQQVMKEERIHGITQGFLHARRNKTG